MKPDSFHREALEEFDAAAIDYAKISPALAHRFYQVMDGLIADACRMPGTFRFIRKPARRHFTREFPFALIYVDRPDDVWILAVMQLHRAPGDWQHRLRLIGSAIGFGARLIAGSCLPPAISRPRNQTAATISRSTPPKASSLMKPLVKSILWSFASSRLRMSRGRRPIKSGQRDMPGLMAAQAGPPVFGPKLVRATSAAPMAWESSPSVAGTTWIFARWAGQR
ncbi:MAG: plasmid stabilization protein [Lacunisphaera sp.]|nr:plasmid stabilization protein [Lacunisphaera sp.]